MKRLSRKALLVVIDLTILLASFWIAFALRFEWAIPGDMLRRMVFAAPYVVTAQYLCLMAFDVPKFSWRYVGLREVTRIGVACAACAVLLVIARLVSGELIQSYSRARYLLIPFGVIAIDFMLALLGLSSARGLRRMLGERSDLGRQRSAKRSVPTMVIGAGGAGLAVAKELVAHPELGILPVGLLDDDASKVGTMLHGLEVLGTTDQLEQLCAARGAEQVLIAIARVSGADVRRINRRCKDAGLPVKIIPALSELVGGQVKLERIRSVAIEDLLRRDPVDLDQSAIAEFVAGKTLLVTGAGGSIGAELCRQLCGFSPRCLVMIDRAENALFFIHRELRRNFPEIELVPRVADVCDRERVRHLLERHRPATVFHAAAHKHVPMMEWNPSQAIVNNVGGTVTVADACVRAGVEAFVLISTDKAVRPTSLMGASKRVAEIYVQALASESSTRFVAVRFGNVLGSAGSVVPIFKEQIASGGPITVTHEEMTRYFMTIPEACQLVLQAGTMGAGGEIFILDMGEPVRIVDLAHDLIRLSGLEPGVDVDIEFVGIRPGEKLHEQLSAVEDIDRTTHPSILVEPRREPSLAEISGPLERLLAAAHEEREAEMRDALAELVDDLAVE